MEHRVKVTVLDKKLFPELQAQYCAVPDSGKCPCYNVGDEFMFYRNDERDDYWHMGAGTLIKSGKTDEGVLLSPGTMHCGTDGVPFCSEAWDASCPKGKKMEQRKSLTTRNLSKRKIHNHINHFDVLVPKDRKHLIQVLRIFRVQKDYTQLVAEFPHNLCG